MPSWKVVLGSDRTFFRVGLRVALRRQKDFEIVGEATMVDAVLPRVTAVMPDVVIVTFSRRFVGGLVETLRRLKRLDVGPAVVVLVDGDQMGLRQRLLAAGAAECLPTSVDVKECLASVVGAAKARRERLEKAPLDANAVVSERERSNARRMWTTALSLRERQVFDLIAQGSTNREAASKLDLSVKTVESYRARVCQKLDLRNRADVIRFALVVGIFGPAGMSDRHVGG